MQFLFKILKLNFLYNSGKLGRRSSTEFGSLTPCWYSYSYHNNRYIFGQGDMTCLRSSKRSLKPGKTRYPLEKHPNNLMPYKIIPRYGLRASKPQQQQHRTATSPAAAVQLRVGGRESWHRSGKTVLLLLRWV